VDGKTNRVAAAVDQLVGPEGGLDARSARAAVLLPAMPLEHEATWDDVHFDVLFELPLHLLECAAALGADLVGVVEIVQDRDGQELGLLGRTVPGARLRLLGPGALFGLLRRAL